MNVHVLRIGGTVGGTVVLGFIQYRLGPPWRFLIAMVETAGFAGVTAWLVGQAHQLKQRTNEQQARLAGIIKVAESANVVHEASKVVDTELVAIERRWAQGVSWESEPEVT